VQQSELLRLLEKTFDQLLAQAEAENGLDDLNDPPDRQG
jgi:hypothetical protein